MELTKMVSTRTRPFDARLYALDRNTNQFRHRCKALEVYLSLSDDFEALLPFPLTPSTIPPVGLIGLSNYLSSNVRPYLEQYSGIQVRDPAGEIGYYIPHIYVSANDNAVLPGHAALGLPTTVAGIRLFRVGGLVQGTLERPHGTRLLTISARPSTHINVTSSGLTQTVYYSVCHSTPGFDPGRQHTPRLVKWRTSRFLRSDECGHTMSFTGPFSLSYGSSAVKYPVFRIGVDHMILGLYQEYDFRLEEISMF
ncbi:hypothetical protein HL667_32255 [Bradyrhizobium sp. 83012]|uniref:Uncharacterized protein n=1 Tax=Bradyrhizobium aeschynomenes TaxID=2734909 RepID=A0ABX2CNB6_9BRAD|nr:hypothetical protein [Bradyrhizobium aeschynomenes]NPU69708.1 hypothetical protein [Bradyrhizobium aeschynomenes]NPV24649.1 hypothetical protein [Bradyrhizobium aeschynomenes]